MMDVVGADWVWVGTSIEKSTSVIKNGYFMSIKVILDLLL